MTQTKDINAKPYVQISGSGPNLVLLHGWGLHGGIWQTILPYLEQHFTIHNVDLPGFGQSKLLAEQSQDIYNIDYLIQSVSQVLPPKCYLMGWSLGGVVATALASQHKDKIEKLVTVASSPCFVANENWPHGMNKEVLETFIDYLSEDFKATLNRFLMIQTMGSATQKQDVAELKETVFRYGLPSEKALNGGLQILHDVDLLNTLCELSVPVLRVYGKLDSLVPVKAAHLVTNYVPQSPAIIFQKSGHAPFLSESEEFIKQIVAYLKLA